MSAEPHNSALPASVASCLDSDPADVVRVCLVGGPTAIVEYGGLRWLTDPTFSPPGEYAGGLVKTTGPALASEELGPSDVVLVSHDQHSDNLDPAGRELVAQMACVFTTTAGAERLWALRHRRSSNETRRLIHHTV